MGGPRFAIVPVVVSKGMPFKPEPLNANSFISFLSFYAGAILLPDGYASLVIDFP